MAYDVPYWAHMQALYEQTKNLQQQQAAQSDIPWMMRGAQPSSQYFSNPAMNMAYNVGSWAVAKSIEAGGNEARVWPQLGPGVGPYQALYQMDVTNKNYDRGMDKYLQGVSNAMGSDFVKAADAMGIRMPRKLRKEIQNAGSTEAGRLIAQAVSSAPALQSVMGGDPTAAYSGTFGARFALSAEPGMAVNPGDIGRQNDISRYQAVFANQLRKAIYTDPVTGEEGITPNQQFLRGFRTEDASALAGYMAQRGFTREEMMVNQQGNFGGIKSSSMRGRDTKIDDKIAMVDDMLGVLDSAREAFESSDVQELLQNLEGLTQGRLPHVNKEALTQAIDNMAATASTLTAMGSSVTASQFAKEIGTMQQQIGVAAGADIDAQGRVIGGFGSMAVGKYMAEQNRIISQRTGESLENVTARQVGLAAVAMRSTQGRDTTMMAYLRERGGISAEQWESFQGAIETGDKAQQLAITRAAYEQFFGDFETGRQLTQNQDFMKQIRSGLSEQAALKALQLTQTGQQRELPERVAMQLERQRGQLISRAQSVAGVGVQMTDAEAAQFKLQAYTDYLRGAGMESEAQALEQTAAGPGGMEAVMEMVATPQFAKMRGAMQRSANNMIDAEKMRRLQQQGGDQSATITGQIGSLRAMMQGDAGREARIQLDQAEKMLEAGDVAGAEAIVKGLTTKLTPEQRKFVEAGGQVNAETFKGIRQSAEATATAAYTMNVIEQTTTANAAARGAIEKAMDAPAADRAAAEADAMKVIEAAQQIDPNVRKEMMAAMKGGDWEEALEMAKALPQRTDYNVAAEGYSRLSKELEAARGTGDISQAKAFLESGALPLKEADKKKMLEALESKDWKKVEDYKQVAERAATQAGVWAEKVAAERGAGGMGEALGQQAAAAGTQEDVQRTAEDEAGRMRMVRESQKDRWATAQQRIVETVTKPWKAAAGAAKHIFGGAELPGEGASAEAAGKSGKEAGTKDAPEERTIKMSGKLVIQKGDRQFAATLEDASGERSW